MQLNVVLTHNLPKGTRLYCPCWFLEPDWPGSLDSQPSASQERHAARGVKSAPEDTWPPSYLDNLLKQRQQLHSLGLNVKEGQIQELIDSLCVN